MDIFILLVTFFVEIILKKVLKCVCKEWRKSWTYSVGELKSDVRCCLHHVPLLCRALILGFYLNLSLKWMRVTFWDSQHACSLFFFFCIPKHWNGGGVLLIGLWTYTFLVKSLMLSTPYVSTLMHKYSWQWYGPTSSPPTYGLISRTCTNKSLLSQKKKFLKSKNIFWL